VFKIKQDNGKISRNIIFVLIYYRRKLQCLNSDIFIRVINVLDQTNEISQSINSEVTLKCNEQRQEGKGKEIKKVKKSVMNEWKGKQKLMSSQFPF
jgi:hypothetical protein